MPVRCDAHGHGPIRWIQPDRRIAIVVELVALVLEVLPKAVQLRPRLVAGRTRQAIFASKGRDSISGRTAQDYEQHHKPGKNMYRTRLLTTHAKAGGHVHTILSANKNVWDQNRGRCATNVPGTPGVLWSPIRDYNGRN